MIYNFKDEQVKRNIDPQPFDVRVFFAALVKQEQERFRQEKEKRNER